MTRHNTHNTEEIIYLRDGHRHGVLGIIGLRSSNSFQRLGFQIKTVHKEFLAILYILLIFIFPLIFKRLRIIAYLAWSQLKTTAIVPLSFRNL